MIVDFFIGFIAVARGLFYILGCIALVKHLFF
jgi:hypothetical protein